MPWSPTPPTAAGYYWWRLPVRVTGSAPNWIHTEIVHITQGRAYSCGWPHPTKVSEMKGEWMPVATPDDVELEGE